MTPRYISLLHRSYRLFPAEVATISIRRRSWWSGLLPSLNYMSEWSGILK